MAEEPTCSTVQGLSHYSDCPSVFDVAMVSLILQRGQKPDYIWSVHHFMDQIYPFILLKK